MEDEVCVLGRAVRRREANAERARDRLPPWIDIDQLHVASSDAASEPRDEAADRAGADDRDAIANRRPAVPESVDGGFEIRGQDGATAWNAIRNHVNRGRRNHITRLMRVEREDIAAIELAGPLFDAADARVSVFHRRRKRARLEGRAHAFMLAARHASLKHHRLAATADPAVERANDDVVRTRGGERLVANLSASWIGDPERARGVGGPPPHFGGLWCGVKTPPCPPPKRAPECRPPSCRAVAA